MWGSYCCYLYFLDAVIMYCSGNKNTILFIILKSSSIWVLRAKDFRLGRHTMKAGEATGLSLFNSETGFYVSQFIC